MTVAEHDLLLRATLGPEAAARDAYEAWRAQADLATLDRASQRVLALLAERLDGQDDEVAAKVRRIARFTWLRTQVLLEHTAPAVQALEAAGVPVMLNKGAAVLAHTGWRVARRPMDDLDVAVPRALARRAIQVLRDPRLRLVAGRRPAPPRRAARARLPGRRRCRARPALARAPRLAAPRRRRRVLGRRAARARARRRVPGAVPGGRAAAAVTQRARVLRARIPLRWAADAAELLRDAPAFDWDRVVEQARRHRLTRELGESLAVLGEVTGSPCPWRSPGARGRGGRESGGDGPLTPTAGGARRRRAAHVGAARGRRPARRCARAMPRCG